MASSANADAILQFTQQNTNLTPIVFDATSSTSTTISTTGAGAVGNNPPGWIPVNVTIGTGGPAQTAFMSFTSALTSSTAGTSAGGSVNQGGYSGTIQFNFVAAPVAASNILTIVFSGARVSGAAGGNSASLLGSQPPDSVTYSSGIPGIAALFAGLDLRNFGLSFSGLTSPLGISGSTVGDNTGSISGTFSASVIPEPSSVVMLSISTLAGLGCYGVRRFRASSV